MRMIPAGLLFLAVLALPVQAQTVPSDLTLTTVASGLTGAVGVRHAGDGSGRLFVIRRQGRIDIITSTGSVLGTPFLNLSVNAPPLGFAPISNPTGTDERGLLGLAFHPLYASNGRVFVYYIDSGNDSVVAEYRVMAGNPNQLDPASARVLLRIWQPANNHNGGDIHFGPDGYLYIGMGDGGSSNDTLCSAGQALAPAATSCTIPGSDAFLQVPPAGVPRGNPDARALLAKMLRIDVDGTTPAPAAGADLCGADASTGGAAYAIPPDNPYVGDTGPRADACDEIYHYGLRNPFRFSFDRLTGDLIIGDVGQNFWEEVNLVNGVAGRNFGWNSCEGFHQRGSSSTLCSLAGRTDPILAYGRSLGYSITGGYRYRGPHASLQGLLFFGDYGDQIFVAQQQGGGNWIYRSISDDPNLPITAGNVVGFGEDEAGHLYVTTLSGLVRRFDVPVPQASLAVQKLAVLSTDGQGAGVADAGDVITYTVTVTNDGQQSLDTLVVSDSFQGGTPVTLSCTPTALDPGHTATCTSYQHVVTQDEIEAGGQLSNLASAEALDESAAVVTGSDEANVPLAVAVSSLDVALAADFAVDEGGDGVADPGDVIEFAASISNGGNVRLTGLAVAQAIGGGAAQALACSPATLQPGAVATCSAFQHTVTQADIDRRAPLLAVVTASATRIGGGSAVQDEAQASTPVPAAAPGLSLTKHAQLVDGDGDGKADAGETINYSFTVGNSGNLTLSGVLVQDPRLGGSVACSPSTLAPGAQAGCGPVAYLVVEADVTQPAIVNEAIAEATAPGDEAVQSETATSSTGVDQGDYVFRDGFEDD